MRKQLLWSTNLVSLSLLGLISGSTHALAQQNLPLFPPSNPLICTDTNQKGVLRWKEEGGVECYSLQGLITVSSCPAGKVQTGVADGQAVCADLKPMIDITACPSGQVMTQVTGGQAVCVPHPLNKSCAQGLAMSGLDSAGNAICTSMSLSNISCPTGQMMSGIDQTGNPICATASTSTSLTDMYCPAGQYMRGIANGSPVCVALTQQTPQQNGCAANPIYTWYGTGIQCTGSLPALSSGGSALLQDAGGKGTITLSCKNGIITSSNPTCTQPISKSCPATSNYTWSVSGNSCAGDVPDLAHGKGMTVRDAANKGTVYIACNNGSYIANQQSCTKPATQDCAATTYSWTVGTATCSGSIIALKNGQEGTLSNTTPGFHGAALARCTNGVWSYPTQNCKDWRCKPTRQEWNEKGGTAMNENLSAAWNQAYCTAIADVTLPGQKVTLSSVNPRTTGTAQYECTQTGTWAYKSGTCTLKTSPTPAPTPTPIPISCKGGTKSWTINGATCSGTVPNMINYAHIDIKSTNGNTGIITANCKDGALSFTNYGCKK